jgi:hypothetical protein
VITPSVSAAVQREEVAVRPEIASGLEAADGAALGVAAIAACLLVIWLFVL